LARPRQPQTGESTLQLADQGLLRHEFARVVQQAGKTGHGQERGFRTGPPGLRSDRSPVQGCPDAQSRRPGCRATSEPHAVTAEVDRRVVAAMAERRKRELQVDWSRRRE
jgi:hypothetical protein